MKTIIAGSRSFKDYELLKDFLDGMQTTDSRISEVVSGCAAGADKLGERWAEENGIPIKPFPADWEGLGKQAGFRRNEKMDDYAEQLVAFWDGVSRGSKHIIKTAINKGLVTWVKMVPAARMSPIYRLPKGL